ncbi:hypothetical protein KIL84_000981 [Mauremys mutica]|uniref:Uncharacterized protein n=1 Tax=Mauremys mutica TaxID=74926 RepID=A0A9D4AVB5_9SAUR|nr:hypothetical protein KIL84_000981 [Mauremys mutica]
MSRREELAEQEETLAVEEPAKLEQILKLQQTRQARRLQDVLSLESKNPRGQGTDRRGSNIRATARKRTSDSKPPRLQNQLIQQTKGHVAVIPKNW